MTAPICMTKEQMREGFAQGRSCVQEEWANPAEIKWADELIAEGAATATAWSYKDGFQCEMRRITGIKPSARTAVHPISTVSEESNG